MIVPKSPTTLAAGLFEVILAPSLAAAFYGVGLSLGWAMFFAVLILTALWFGVWLLAKERAGEAALTIIEKSLLLNAAFSAFAPFVPMALWLNHDVGLSKQWAGSLTCLLFVVTVFVIFVVSSLVPRKGEKEAARASTTNQQGQGPHNADPKTLFTTFFPDTETGEETTK